MTVRSPMLVGLAAVLVMLSFAVPAQATEPSNSATSATVANDNGPERVVTMAEFRKMLAEPYTTNPGCGARCDYKNPQTYWAYYCGAGCPDNWKCVDDAITVNENGSGPHLDFRYSPACRTGWARGRGCYDSQGNLVVGLGFYSLYTASFNNKRAETWGPAATGTCYSRMLSIAGMWGLAAYQYGPSTTYSSYVYGY